MIQSTRKRGGARRFGHPEGCSAPVGARRGNENVRVQYFNHSDSDLIEEVNGVADTVRNRMKEKGRAEQE